MKIISFDGGGIRGILTIQILKRIIQKYPDFLKTIDLFAGTSTGGLIALTLAGGKDIGSIFDLYHDTGKYIFDPRRFGWEGILTCRYNNEKYKTLLEVIFGRHATLGDLKKKVLIPTFDLDGSTSRDETKKRWKAKFFNNISPTDPDCLELVINIALYTSAAPTYFPSVDGFVDGGVVCNNPSACTVHQLISDRPSCHYKLEDIKLLSIGTGGKLDYLRILNRNWGAIKWSGYLLDILFDGLTDVADFQCQSMLDDRYHRIEPLCKNFPAMDDWKKADEFVRIANEVDLTKTFDWIEKTW